MPSGKKIEVSTGHKAKAPKCVGLEGFLPVLNSQASMGWLPLQLFVQPLTDVIGDYTRQNGEEKR